MLIEAGRIEEANNSRMSQAKHDCDSINDLAEVKNSSYGICCHSASLPLNYMSLKEGQK